MSFLFETVHQFCQEKYANLKWEAAYSRSVSAT